MKREAQKPERDGDSWARFRVFAERLVAVPKKEIDQQAAAWKRRKNKKKAHASHIVT